MSAAAITAGKNKFVVGLNWEVSPDNEVVKAAKTAAKLSRTPVFAYAVRRGDKRLGRAPQFGLWCNQQYQYENLPVLAPSLANRQTGSWAAAFRVHEGFVVELGWDDLIMPDGDAFYKDEKSAKDRLLKEIESLRFNRVYAPQNWGIPKANPTPLLELIENNVDSRLMPLTLSPAKKTALIAALAIFVAALGVAVMATMSM